MLSPILSYLASTFVTLLVFRHGSLEIAVLRQGFQHTDAAASIFVEGALNCSFVCKKELTDQMEYFLLLQSPSFWKRSLPQEILCQVAARIFPLTGKEGSTLSGFIREESKFPKGLCLKSKQDAGVLNQSPFHLCTVLGGLVLVCGISSWLSVC